MSYPKAHSLLHHHPPKSFLTLGLWRGKVCKVRMAMSFVIIKQLTVTNATWTGDVAQLVADLAHMPRTLASILSTNKPGEGHTSVIPVLEGESRRSSEAYPWLHSKLEPCLRHTRLCLQHKWTNTLINRTESGLEGTIRDSCLVCTRHRVHFPVLQANKYTSKITQCLNISHTC